MLLEFDADQRLWQETVRDAVSKQCPASLIRDIAENGVDSAPLWNSYVEAGWTELTDQENAVELAIVLEELGRATDPTPMLATLTQYAPLVGDRFDPLRAGAAVYSGVAADQVATRRVDVFDPVLHVAEVSFGGVHIADSERLSADTERAHHVALMGMAITMVGACQRILDLVVEHAKSRQQFGVAIGTFQAVQHKATDMYVAIERARALSYFAALTIAADDPRRRLAAAMAKASAGECQALVFKHGIQLFGAMGFTWENDLQFALKRAKAGELMLGGAAEHRALIAEQYGKDL
ncbi:MAG: acyl-CoA dehydrogenase family protein [Mycobacterium sp.]|nr:acyl-CoA dehydrogenase family protein [Mycobacterium sp.]